ncbi:hypothetical protein BDV93DRAFT_549169 [Ceratobasidium sp. AG-I]|nr:hypothetical protein BDV93DRAFT_549169 [Ceratobasidium sp. AG-I]
MTKEMPPTQTAGQINIATAHVASQRSTAVSSGHKGGVAQRVSAHTMHPPGSRLKQVRFVTPSPGAKLSSAGQALVTRVLEPLTASQSPKHPPPPSITSSRPTTQTTPGDCSYILQNSPLSFCATNYDRYDATHLDCVLDNILAGSVPMSAATTALREPEIASPHAALAPAENWDDDFLFQAEDSPAKPPAAVQPRTSLQTGPPERRWSSHSVSDAGGWDEELEREEAERQSSAESSSAGPSHAVAPRTDLSRWAEPDEDDDEDFGFAPTQRRAETVTPHTRHPTAEDTVSPLPVFPTNPGTATLPSPSKRQRTNTSPSRSSTSTSASARSSPLMHARHVPSSPALSLFSTSTSTAQPYSPSLASSTQHLRTTRSHDASSILGPYVPAQPRVPRRRLRKKSRPARPGDIAEDDGGAYVMREPSPPGGMGALGLAMTEEEGAWSESSNQQDEHREQTPSPPRAPIAGPSSPPTRTPLLTRIGSLKTKLGRRPKPVISPSPPSAYASGSTSTSTAPIPITPATPARTRAPRSSTTPKQRTHPETPNRARAPGWFRSASGQGVPGGSSPEDMTIPSHPGSAGVDPSLSRRKSKEPFWKTVGSFSSARSPVLATNPTTSDHERADKSDHESTVKKPVRKSLSTTTRPPLPLPPLEAGSPTPTGGGKLTKPRRPVSLAAPLPVMSRASASGGRVAASLGKGTGAGWASALTGFDDPEKDKDKDRTGDGPRLMRSLRRFSHARKKSSGAGASDDLGLGLGLVGDKNGGVPVPRIPSSSTAESVLPASSTAGSRVASTSTVPSIHEHESGSVWGGDGGRKTSVSGRRPSVHEPSSRRPSGAGSMRKPSGSGSVHVPKSASAVVLSSTLTREYDPSGSVFTLPLGLGGNEREERESGEGARPSLSVDGWPGARVSSGSRPSSPLVGRPATPLAHAARPSSPLATRNRRPSTPLVPRPGTPLAGPPVTSSYEDEGSSATTHESDTLQFNEPIVVREPVTPSRKRQLPSPVSAPVEPIVMEGGVEFAVVSPVEVHGRTFRSPASDNSTVTGLSPSAGRPSFSSTSRTSSSLGSGSRSLIHRKSASLAHTKSASEPSRLTSDLLPPIELQPPSPPQSLSGATGVEHQSLLLLATPPESGTGLITPSGTPSKLHARLHSGNSPIGQASSLGRAATQPGGPLDASASVLRRNSLSDLKIPARISRAQSGLKSNLGMVREFAGSIEQIRNLQALYRNLLADLKYAIENGEPLSPVLFPPATRGSATSATLVRVPSRDIGRVANRLNTIDDRYGLWWECADVLVELGGGGSSGGGGSNARNTGTTNSTTSGDKVAPPTEPGQDTKVVNGRERAITLAGNQSAPTVEPTGKKEQWDKERGELSPRQLQILREMLSTPNPSALHVPLPVSTPAAAPGKSVYLNALHPGGTASAITLPSSSASSHVHGLGQGPSSRSVVKLPARKASHASQAATTGPGKIRRASRAGITGIRDLLKHLNLKKPSSTGNGSAEGESRPPTRLGGAGKESQVHLPQAQASRADLAMQSQLNLGHRSQSNLGHPSQLNLGHTSQLALDRPYQHHSKRSHGPAAAPVAIAPVHKSPRRPSLASIFRLNSAGGRSKSKGRAVSQPQGTPSTTEDDADESDWDRMDSASDLDLRARSREHAQRTERGGETQRKGEKDATLRGRKGHGASASNGGDGRPPVPALPAEFASSRSQLSLKSPEEESFGKGTDLAAAGGISPVGQGGPSLSEGAAGEKPIRSGSNRFRQKPPSALSQTAAQAVQPGLRSAPLQPASESGYPGAGGVDASVGAGVEGRLSLTPENIKPLLEYAREVTARLGECVAELRELGMNDPDKLGV